MLTLLDPPPPECMWRRVSIAPDYEVSEYGHLRRRPDAWVGWRPRGHILVPKITSLGYARYTVRVEGRSVFVQAHRLVAFAFLGEPEAGRQVAHNDGKPINCHFSNLRWATPKENSADRTRHGTQHRGESTPTSVLTENQVARIKRETHLSGVEIGRVLGVSPQQVSRIRSGKAWAHIDGPAPRNRHRNARLSDEQVVDMRNRWAAGESVRSLSRHFGIHRVSVKKAVTGATYGNLPPFNVKERT